MRDRLITLNFFIRLLKDRMYMEGIFDEIANMLTQLQEISDLLEGRLEEAWLGLAKTMRTYEKEMGIGEGF